MTKDETIPLLTIVDHRANLINHNQILMGPGIQYMVNFFDCRKAYYLQKRATEHGT